MGRLADATGFESPGEYVRTALSRDGVCTYPRTVATRLFKTKTFKEMQEDSAASNGHVELKRTMGWFQLVCTGAGFMIGAGIFVSPGYIATSLTGPALFLAYGVAAISAFLSSFCYSEFTVTMPLAGASYNYTYATLGEFIAWVVVSNMILQYILANAAAVRGFAPYMALLFNKPTDFFLKPWNGYLIDGWAGGVTVLCTCLLSWGMQESATTNAVITVVHVALMVLMIIAGLTKADADNMRPLFLEGGSWKDIFNGGAVAFFSYLGFDAVATTAEEVKNPARNLPIGILGSVGLVTVIYMLLTATLTLMVPISAISEDAAFAAAFDYVGYSWAKYIIALAALMGIFTTTLIGVLGGARVLVGAARERMLPPFFAQVGAWRQTPWVATWAIGLPSAGIAVFTGFADLADMISIGTFLVFMIVAFALLWLRCHVPGKSTRKNLVLLWLHTAAFLGISLGFTLVWKLPIYQEAIPGDEDVPEVPAGKWAQDQWKWLIGLGITYIAAVISCYFCVKQDFVSDVYRVPFFPAIPAASIFVNVFLMGQLSVKSYQSFAWWTVASVALYLVYGMVAQQAMENRKKEAGYVPDSSGSGGGAAAKSEKELYLADMASLPDSATPHRG